MEYPQAPGPPSFPKFTFPIHILSVMSKTTGGCLGRDKIVGVGAALYSPNLVHSLHF